MVVQVTSGRALCGRIGGKLRSEYAMVGDVINLAARFMSKAKGRILCDDATYSKASIHVYY
jgi:class 3 adenylate cyclase